MYDGGIYSVIDDKNRIIKVDVGNGLGITTSKVLRNNPNEKNEVDVGSTQNYRKYNGYLTTGLILGFLSIFFFEIGIIPDTRNCY
ncbi:hypothetical protein [Alkalibacillus filiformis]|nr:hypothetical protein [Alkalibacillus filiformis]